LLEVQADALAAPLLAPLATGVIDEDAAHGLRRGGEEVAATVPVLRSLDVHQPEVGFVNQGRGLERLARLLLRHPLGSQLTQLALDERKQLLRRAGVALLDGGQDARHLTHWRALQGECGAAARCRAPRVLWPTRPHRPPTAGAYFTPPPTPRRAPPAPRHSPR